MSEEETVKVPKQVLRRILEKLEEIRKKLPD